MLQPIKIITHIQIKMIMLQTTLLIKITNTVYCVILECLVVLYVPMPHNAINVIGIKPEIG